MKPLKIALIGSAESVNSALVKTLASNIEIDQFEYADAFHFSGHAAILYHHQPEETRSLETILQLKKAHPQCAVVVISEKATPYEVAQAFRMGANDYLLFPLDENLLHSTIHRHLVTTSDTKKIELVAAAFSIFLSAKNSPFYSSTNANAEYGNPEFADSIFWKIESDSKRE